MPQRGRIYYTYSHQSTLLMKHFTNLTQKLHGSVLFIECKQDHECVTRDSAHSNQDIKVFGRKLIKENTVRSISQISSLLQFISEDGKIVNEKIQLLSQELLETSNSCLSLLLLLIANLSRSKNDSLIVKRVLLLLPENGFNVMKYSNFFSFLLREIIRMSSIEILILTSEPLLLRNALLPEIKVLKETNSGILEIALTKRNLRKAYLHYPFTIDLALALQSEYVLIVETQAQAIFVKLLIQRYVNDYSGLLNLILSSFHVLNLEQLPLEVILQVVGEEGFHKTFYAILNKERIAQIFDFFQGSKSSKPPFKGSFEKKIEWLRTKNIFLFKTNFEIDLIYNNEKTVLQVLKKYFYMDYEKIKRIPRSKPEYKDSLLRVLRQRRNEFAYHYLNHANNNELPLAYQLFLRRIK